MSLKQIGVTECKCDVRFSTLSGIYVVYACILKQ